MRTLVLALSMVGCWSDAQPAQPAPPPVVAAKAAPAKPAPYGSGAYGGDAYGSMQKEVFLTSTGDISSGYDDTKIYGSLLGDGTIGDGSGVGAAGGAGGVGGMHGARSAVPTVSIGQPQSAAGLDKAIIRRYIKRNIQKIQYCYEKQLLQSPGIAGKVTVQFRIEATGKVDSSVGRGLAVVDACVADVILGIEFPKPQDGGVVEVTYPFEFRAAE